MPRAYFSQLPATAVVIFHSKPARRLRQISSSRRVEEEAALMNSDHAYNLICAMPEAELADS